jgi:CRISPR/Cas system-associated endonuclease Cas1
MRKYIIMGVVLLGVFIILKRIQLHYVKQVQIESCVETSSAIIGEVVPEEILINICQRQYE